MDFYLIVMMSIMQFHGLLLAQRSLARSYRIHAADISYYHTTLFITVTPMLVILHRSRSVLHSPTMMKRDGMGANNRADFANLRRKGQAIAPTPRSDRPFTYRLGQAQWAIHRDVEPRLEY